MASAYEIAITKRVLARLQEEPDVVERVKIRLSELPSYLSTTEGVRDIKRLVELYEELDRGQM